MRRRGHFFMDRLADAFRVELAAFTQVMAGRRTSPCTVADALEANWIADACTLSLREHRPVQIEEVRIPDLVPASAVPTETAQQWSRAPEVTSSRSRRFTGWCR